MDVVSEILSGIKLQGAVYFHAELSAPWGVVAPNSSHQAAELAPGAQHMVTYHFLVEGHAFARVAGDQTVELHAGDVVIFPHGDAHQIASDLNARPPFPDYGINAKIRSRDLRPLRAGGNGRVSRIVCGYMTFDPRLGRPNLSGLPPVFKVPIRADRSGQWLENSILHLVDEAGSGLVGSEAMLAKLSEALFVDTLRRYVASLPEKHTGWLAGARDPIVGKSLQIGRAHV